MTRSSKILQIVPRPPGMQDGVGDYALTVSRKLRDRFDCQTIFAAPATSVGEPACHAEAERRRDSFPRDFEILPLSGSLAAKEFDHVILHYVNYGYQKRGVPFGLLSILRQLRRQCSGRLLTVFHELYASGPPWRSAFWLRPFQKHIARRIAQISDTAIVSSETMLAQLQNSTPVANARVHPVFSNFGEPTLTREQLADRSPHRWAICGGTTLVERSLRSFRTISKRIPEQSFPRQLFVLGGKPNPAIRALIVDLPNLEIDYRPQVAAAEASEILSSCAFAWLDYFHRADVPTDAVLKSSAFAAACAHGVITIFPNVSSAIGIDNDRLPGPYFVDSTRVELPRDQSKAASETYDWYLRRAASSHVVRGIAGALGLGA